MKLYREVNKPTKYVLQDWTRKGSYGMCPYIGHLEPYELPTEEEIKDLIIDNFQTGAKYTAHKIYKLICKNDT
jgi:hypothetical protein